MPKLTEREMKKGLRDSLADGTAFSVSSTLTGTYSIPFALALGANPAEVGLMSALPKLAGTLVQPWVAPLIRKFKGRKRMSVVTSVWARLLWIPIALLPFVFGPMLPDGRIAIFMLIALLSLYQLLASASVTAWSGWIGDLVPEKVRGKFFGKRGMLAGVAGFLTTLAGGLLLGVFNGAAGFAILFGISTFFGLVSSWYLNRMPDPQPHDGEDAENAFSELRGEVRQNPDFKRFLIFSTAMVFAVQIASPFFAVSLLSDFKVGYEVYAIVMAASTLATILTQPYWGRIADRYGDRTTIAICSVLIALVPGLWLFVHSPWQMIAVFGISGFAWAGFDLAMFNYVLDASPARGRSIYMANYSMLNGVANFAGPLAGGALAELTMKNAFFGLAGLQVVFALSFVLRLLSAGLWIPKLKELRASNAPPATAIFWKAVTVFPVRFYSHEIALGIHFMHHRPRGPRPLSRQSRPRGSRTQRGT
jgi:MFS family permease